MKKLITGALIGLGMLVLTVAPSSAQEYYYGDCGNYTTGPDSWNICARISAKLNRVRVRNSGHINQTVNSNANTGGNVSNDNTISSMTMSSVDAGDASVMGSRDAYLNSVYADIDQTTTNECTDCIPAGGNEVTGPDSVNVNVVADVKAVSVDVDNEGYINQRIRSRANSGNNTVNHNTSAGGIVTGNATVDEAVYADLNYTNVVISQ